MDIQQLINSPTNTTPFVKKGFNAKTSSINDNGDYINNSIKPNNFKTRHIEDIINYVLPNIQTLSNRNPRFNKFINPLYYIGLKGVGESTHLDFYKEKDSTTSLDNKIKEISSKSLLLTGISNRNDLLQYNIPNELKQSPKNYTELFVTPNSKTKDSYLSLITSYGKGKIINLLNMANKSVDSIIPDFVKDVNNTVQKFTGADFLGLKDGFITQAEAQYLSGDSDDPLYGAKYGLAIGQTTGKAFRHSIEGFSNSYKEDFPNSYANLLNQELNKFTGQSGDKNAAPGHWHLPFTDPTEYSVDERRKKSMRKTDTINNSTLDTITNKVSEIVGSVFSGDLSINPQSLISSFKQSNTFTDKSLTNKLLSFGNDNTLDNLSDLFSEGSQSINENLPLIAQESHKQYINIEPIGEPSRWWNITNDKIYQDNMGFFDELVLEINKTKSGINVKTDKREFIENMKYKTALKSDNLIYEGVQQFDGKYDGVNYNEKNEESFSPQSSRAEYVDQSYMANVRKARINEILGEPEEGNKRDYSINPTKNWIDEPQFFPFYFRTLNRDDYAIVQQPIYDNGAVIMSKKKITGNSIVFLECSIDSISESFQHTVNKENYLGRTESILSYAGASRSFSLSFYIMCTSPKEVPSMRAKVNELIRMSYPQVMALNDIGVIGYRRNPYIEWRIGDQWFLQGMISNITPDWMINQLGWEIIPGGRVLRACKIQMTFEITHWEQPNASTDFYSPTFNPQVFFENHIDTATEEAKKTSQTQTQNAVNSLLNGGKNIFNNPSIKDLPTNPLINNSGFNLNNVINNLPSF